MKVQNKIFIVTGAGGGVGRELVLCLLSKGARVAGVDLAPEALQETASLTGPDQDSSTNSWWMLVTGQLSKRCRSRSSSVSEPWMGSSTTRELFSPSAD